MLRYLPLLLLPLAGCLFAEDDDEPPAVCGDGIKDATEQCDDGNLADGDVCSSTCKTVEQHTVHWSTSSVSGQIHSCPAGFDVARVIVEPVKTPADCTDLDLESCTFERNGPDVVFTAPCANGATRVQLPPHDTYRVAVSFENSTSSEVYGETLQTWLREVTTVVMYEDQGFVHVGWNLRDTNGTVLDCFNANVLDVTINVKAPDGWVAGTQTVLCRTLALYTPPIVAGTDYTVELVTSRGTTTVPAVSIAKRSAVTELGEVTLVVPAMN